MDKLICRKVMEDVYEVAIIVPSGLIFVENRSDNLKDCLSYAAKVAARNIIDKKEFKFIIDI